MRKQKKNEIIREKRSKLLNLQSESAIQLEKETFVYYEAPANIGIDQLEMKSHHSVAKVFRELPELVNRGLTGRDSNGRNLLLFGPNNSLFE